MAHGLDPDETALRNGLLFAENLETVSEIDARGGLDGS